MFNKDAIKGYELLKEFDIKDISSKGYLLSHIKSGARILLIENDDDNKVFSIGFRTPPSDSTGVPHIMEHSVLCGSKKFPVKDPFVELIKGSLNTFLNAMTFPDKTVYPVASCNDKDFANLCDVYMDAVLHPNIYNRPQIFKQEGWHYELLDENDDIKINGVVYNEMKGAFSSPEDLMDREVFNSLFPDTPYAKESGGDPEVIPELSYEAFLDFHRKYYHPTNSYIYLYGNMDFNEKLEWLDSEYLSEYEKIDIDTSIKPQDAFKKPVFVEKEYGITEDEGEENNTFLSKNYVIDTSLNKELYTAFAVLEYALVISPGAPLKQRLLDEGIGSDIYSNYENGIAQPYFSIIAKNANPEDRDKFIAIIEEELNRLTKDGIDKNALLAGINAFEFRYREADFGSYPKGLMYGLQCLDSWLYDENEPLMHISQNDTYAYLREAVKGDYFEKLISKYLLGNMHSSAVVIKPSKGLTTKKDAKLAKKLAEYKESLSADEIKKIICETKMLKAYQEEPSTQEELKTIPLLEIEDIKKNPEPYSNEEMKIGNIPVLLHDVETNGIGYMSLIFDASGISVDKLPAFALLSSFLTLVSTKKYHYSDLLNVININSGGITPAVGCYPDLLGSGEFKATFDISAKFLYDQADFVCEIIDEILHNSLFDDKKRLFEILSMTKSRMEMALMQSGHTASVKRALSHFSKIGYYNEMTSGIEMFKYIKDLCDDFDNKADALIVKLNDLVDALFKKGNLMVDYTGNKASVDIIRKPLLKLYDTLGEGKSEPVLYDFKPSDLKEAYKTSAQVQYVGCCGNYRKDNLEYDGALRVLHTIFASEYLWLNVRVMGGAYGCMCNFPRSGDSYFVSYRDPHLNNTLKIYEEAAEYVKNIEIDDRDMTKYIIGTISDMDVPLTPRTRGNRSFLAYMGNLTYDIIKKDREKVLNCTVEDIRALSPYVESIVNQAQLCVIGAEEKINTNSNLFDRVENLF